MPTNEQIERVAEVIEQSLERHGVTAMQGTLDDAIAALSAAGNAEPVAWAVKPLEWHKSHMPSWNDDWHTIRPIIYTIRCADENGWKWSYNGGHGYAPSPDAAKAEVEAHHKACIRSALEPVKASPWQPIETAPKDGSKIDLWAKFEKSGWRRVPDAHWNEAIGDWQLGNFNAADYMVRPEITHWMPLPPTPEAPDE